MSSSINNLPEGSAASATLNLHLKIINHSSDTIFSVPTNFGLLADESGDIVHQANVFTFVRDGLGLGPYAVSNEDAVFPIPAGGIDFIFMIGDASDTSFVLSVNQDGTVYFQKSLAAEPASTTVADPFLCGGQVRRVPQDYQTIQAAISAANSGDTVSVAAGMYQGSLTIGRSICLEGVSRDQTVIMGGDGGPVITVENVSWVALKNFTAEGGHNYVGTPTNGMGGGILTLQADHVFIQSCRLTQNSADSGGGLYVNHTTNFVISGCLIDSNHAYSDGGVWIEPNLQEC